MPREILVDWVTQSGAGKVSVFHFLEATPIADQRAALADFLDGVDGSIAAGTSWTIRTTGVEYDAATGALEGAWADGTAYTGPGSAGGEPVPDAAQVLFRWITDHIVGRRFLQGRTYIPGWSVANVDNGNLAEANRAGVQVLGNDLVNAGVQLAVWHRPVAGSGGEAWAVDECVVSSEFAVLRRRR